MLVNTESGHFSSALCIFYMLNVNTCTAFTLPRDYILNTVWGYDYFGDLRTVDTHIKKLRAKLGNEGRYIGTVIRAGYKFEMET